MPVIQRSALVEHSAAKMFALVNDIDAYPRRFDWCEAAQVLEADETRVVIALADERGIDVDPALFTLPVTREAPQDRQWVAP